MPTQIHLLDICLHVPLMSRSGDRECPMRVSGNRMAETIRQTIEDPMSFFVESKLQQREEKYARVDHLKVSLFYLV